MGGELRAVPAELKELPDSIFEGHETVIGNDLKQNLIDLLEKSALSPAESGFALLAIATSVGLDALAHYAREKLARLSIPQEQMQEAAESAAHMAMLNVYYSFRDLLLDDDQYGPTKLRMNVLMTPKLGRQCFDMLSFALSVLNGCHPCILGHEKTLRESGVSVEKIHDLARLAAVVKGLRILMFA